MLAVVGIIFVILVIYHQTIGYYIQFGWKSIWDLIEKKEDVSVTISPDNVPAMNASITKYNPDEEQARIRDEIMQKQAMEAPPPFVPPPPILDDRSFQFPSMGASTSTVYNISENIYTYHDAAAVCRAFNGELANYDQVKEAHQNGADWCNYGWIKGQQAVYPTQKTTWEKLQKGAPEYANSCGKPGVNGGRFDNPELRFGVNCYGVRPPKSALDEDVENQAALPPSTDEIEFDKKVQHYRDNMQNIAILPFNHRK